jgi:hypothetical protein
VTKITTINNSQMIKRLLIMQDNKMMDNSIKIWMAIKMMVKMIKIKMIMELPCNKIQIKEEGKSNKSMQINSNRIMELIWINKLILISSEDSKDLIWMKDKEIMMKWINLGRVCSMEIEMEKIKMKILMNISTMQEILDIYQLIM